MTERFLVSDTLIAWYGSLKNGRKLQGLSIFTQTTDSFNPNPSASRFKDWLVCCQTASGVASELVGVGPSGHFDPLITQLAPWFAEGNLIACPLWEYQTTPSDSAWVSEVAAAPAPGPDLDMIIRKLGL